MEWPLLLACRSSGLLAALRFSVLRFLGFRAAVFSFGFPLTGGFAGMLGLR